MRELNEAEVKTMVTTVTHYFAHLTPEAAKVSAAYLHEGGGAPPALDFTGIIAVSGQYRGCIYFTAPRLMLRYLLLHQGEAANDDAAVLDAVGEIANTISGNARREFGSGLDISVPITVKGPSEVIRASVRARPVVIRIEWRGLAAALVVDVAPAH